MDQLHFIKGYYNQDVYRKSLSDLADLTFGISFENWYQHGFWNDRYVPFSFYNGQKIVSNVSVHLLELMIEGKVYRAGQIGTVMTHPDYQNQGLAARLISKAMEEIEERCDIFYLFANKKVLDLYPKFGFTPMDETIFSMEFNLPLKDKQVVRLNGRNEAHLAFIFDIASRRVNLSERFSALNAQRLLMFYCMEVFYEHIYYLQDERAIVLFVKDDEIIEIIDIISDQKVSIRSIVQSIGFSDTRKVIFHFTPNDSTLLFKATKYEGDEVLFVKAKTNSFNFQLLKHPLTSQG